MHSLRCMRLRPARNEPRKRIARARAAMAAQGRADEEEVRALTPARRSQVEVRTMAARSRVERRHPTRLVAESFAVLSVVGMALLMLPGMTNGERAPVLTALFTSVSAACVTGLTVVDTATYWTPLGQVVILLLIQLGGFGIQALGTLMALMLSRKMGSGSRLAAAQAETGALSPGDVRRVLRALLVITVVVELAVAATLTVRFMAAYGATPGSAAWQGLFHSVSAFNNAGFALRSDSLMTYGQDPWVLGPISVAIVLGGLGFLVIVELVSRATGARGLIPRRRRGPMTQEEVLARGRELARRSRYRLGDSHPERLGFANPIPLSVHTRLMLRGTALLVVVGTLGFALFEWTNPGTLAAMPWWEKVVQSLFSGGVTPRTAGFNSVDYAQALPETRFLTDGLMFVGGGSGSTAGGIKVTTLMILTMAMVAEVRGQKEVTAADRRIPDSVVRIAIAVTMVSAAAVGTATIALISLTDLTLDLAMFEVVSALATVGLTANVTPTLPWHAQLLIIALMLLGRIGPLTLASALTLRQTHRAYRLPEGRPLVG